MSFSSILIFLYKRFFTHPYLQIRTLCAISHKSAKTTIWNRNEAQSARAESTHKGVNQRSKYVTQTQQQRPESPTVALTWQVSKYKVYVNTSRTGGCFSGGVDISCNRVLRSPMPVHTQNEPFHPKDKTCQPQSQDGQVECGLGVAQSYHSAVLTLVRLTLSLLRWPLPLPVVHQTAVHHQADSANPSHEFKVVTC